MKTSVRFIVVVVVIGALVGGLVVADQLLRSHVERQISAQVADEFGGVVSTELGGWPFIVARLSNRLADARVNIHDAAVSVADRQATIDNVNLTAVGISPLDDLPAARADRLDAQVSIDWQQLTLLLGFPVGYAGDARVAARTSVEVFGVVAVAELQAEITVDPTGRLQLHDPSATAAGVELPGEIVRLAVNNLAPDLQLPTFTGLSYQQLTLGEAGISTTLTGTEVALSGLR